jgi:hypothetical protein
MIVTAPQQKTIQVIFEDSAIAAVAVEMASNFIGQATEDGVVLTICQSTPPVIVGTPESQKEQFERIKSIKAKVLARYSLTRKRAEELIGILQQSIEILDKLEGK